MSYYPLLNFDSLSFNGDGISDPENQVDHVTGFHVLESSVNFDLVKPRRQKFSEDWKQRRYYLNLLKRQTTIKLESYTEGQRAKFKHDWPSPLVKCSHCSNRYPAESLACSKCGTENKYLGNEQPILCGCDTCGLKFLDSLPECPDCYPHLQKVTA